MLKLANRAPPREACRALGRQPGPPSAAVENNQAQRIAAAVLSVAVLHSGCQVPAAWGHISLQQQSRPGPAPFDAAFFTPPAPPSPPSSSPSSSSPPKPSAPGPRPVALQAADALRSLQRARALSDDGDYAGALQQFDDLIREHPDLALTEYGRIGRALVLYQVGRTSDALAALEDEQVALAGSAEVHSALAAVLYVERPQQRQRAEQEWDAGAAFDTRYTNLEYVRQQKHWPPRMLGALQRFLSLD